MSQTPIELGWKCCHTVQNENGERNTMTEEEAPPSAKANDVKLISLGLMSHNNLEVVKRINRASFPLTYGENFYSMIVDNRELCRLAFVCDIPVGAVCCRLISLDDTTDPISEGDHVEGENIVSLLPPRLRQWELTTASSTMIRTRKAIDIPKARLCILTLAVLAPYRRSGIGRLLLNWVIRRAEELRAGEAGTAIGSIPGLSPGQTQVDVKEVYLQVWSSNNEAIEFYKNMGFEQAGELKGYYRNLSPPDGIIFKKSFPLIK